MEVNGLVEEQFFFPRMMALTKCVKAELLAAGGPGLCFSGLVPAGRPPLGVMNCGTTGCGGVAWVAPVTAYPVGVFPSEGEVAERCVTPMAMTVQVGVARCHPRPRQGMTTVDEQDAFEAARLYMSDMAAVKRAILCCFPKDNPNYQVALGTWEPLPPEASASGGSWTAYIG